MKIFVASSGRCGTGYLASGFKKYTSFNVFHEQAPVLVGPLLYEANEPGLKSEALWAKCDRIQHYDNYIDTAHQFMRGFYKYALEFFNDIKVIKLARDPLEVARSRINRMVVPGRTQWLSRYDDELNLLKLTENEYSGLTDLQKILLDWFEHEERFYQARHEFGTIVYLSFDALTKNTAHSFKRIFRELGIVDFNISNLQGMHTNSNSVASVVQPGDQKKFDELLALLLSKGYSLDWMNTAFYRRVIKRHDVYTREQQLLTHYNKHIAYSSVNPDFAFKFLPKLDGCRILDLGCGDGRFSKYLVDKFGCSVVGVDFSTNRIAAAREKYSGIPFFCKNAYSFAHNYIGQKFDYVFMTEFLEHLEEPELLLNYLKRISNNIIGTVPKNHHYIAHLQVYKSAKAFRERFHMWPIRTKVGPAIEGGQKNVIYFYTS